MARITRRPPPKPKPKYLHEANVRISEIGDPWVQREIQHVAGPIGHAVRKRFWSYRIIAFDTTEKAEQFARRLARYRRDRESIAMRGRPCPRRARYDEAAAAQHAVIWGLSTGVIREVVRTYRRERCDCSTHGHPNWIASDVILAAAPSIGRDRARKMVDAMLAWIIARHATWFWSGLQGDQIINKY